MSGSQIFSGNAGPAFRILAAAHKRGRLHEDNLHPWPWPEMTGGPSSFQRLMDNVLHGLSFVTSNIDQMVSLSTQRTLNTTMNNSSKCLHARLSGAGLTCRGAKCKIACGMKEDPCILSSWYGP